MKKLAALVLALFTVVTVAPVFAGGNKESGGNKVVLTMGSWRADECRADETNLLAEYRKLLRMSRFSSNLRILPTIMRRSACSWTAVLVRI